MFSPMIRTIAAAAALAMISACGGVSDSPGSGLPAINPSSTRSNGRLHGAAASSAPQSGTLFVADESASDILIFSTGVTPGSSLGLVETGKITSGVSQPRVLATGVAGDLFVGNAGDNTVKEYPTGSLTPSVTIRKVYSPQGLAIDQHGNVWVSQLQTDQSFFPVVDEYAYNSKSKTFATRPTKTIIGSGSASLVFPHGLAFDSSGNLFIADAGHSDALLEVKSNSTTPALVPLPTLAQSSAIDPGFIVAPSGVCVSGSGSGEKLEISDAGTGTLTNLSLGATKAKWSLSLPFFSSPVNLLSCTVDGNGFSYALAFSSGGSSAPSWDIVLVNPAGNVAQVGSHEQFQQNSDQIQGLAFTSASRAAATRSATKGTFR
jgi:sugar lactone lactonase YvrE